MPFEDERLQVAGLAPVLRGIGPGIAVMVAPKSYVVIAFDDGEANFVTDADRPALTAALRRLIDRLDRSPA